MVATFQSCGQWLIVRRFMGQWSVEPPHVNTLAGLVDSTH